MKRVWLLIVLFVKAFFCYSQKENNIWYFGDKAGVDFNSGIPANLSDGQLNTIEGCATISNVSGQLLFYTDGVKIWDRNHDLMPNGQNLKGNFSSTQSAVIVPKPNSSSIYYVFTTAQQGEPEGICYSEVDMNLNGGLGDVTATKNIQLYTPTCEKLCAVKNPSDQSYWVVSHGFGNNTFMAFKVDQMGINTSPVLSNAGTVIASSSNTFHSYNVQGYLKFSADGRKLVCVNRYINTELFDFDTQTGIVSNPKIINQVNQNRYSYGAEFSPSGNILYLSTSYSGSSNSNKIYQYNLLATDIPGSEQLITPIGSYNFGGLQLASNCKLYISNHTTLGANNTLFVINNPDILGMNCDFQSSNIRLSGTCFIGLPQFIEYSTCKNRNIIYEENCQNVTFYLGGDENITSAVWHFGDGNASNLLSPIHQYSHSGTYLVSGDFTSANAHFSISKEIIIEDKPIANPVDDVILCGWTNNNYNLSNLNTTVLGNQSNQIYGVCYFASMIDLINHQNILSPEQIYTTTAVQVFAKVFRWSNFNCYGYTSFNIRLQENPIVQNVSDYCLCDDGLINDGIMLFDLSSKTPEILAGQSSNDFKVSYHLTLEDAQNNIHPILTQFANSSSPQIIYARISRLPGEKCYQTTSFNLIVRPSPEFDIKPVYTLCNGGVLRVSVPDLFSSYLWAGGSQAHFTYIATSGNFWVTVSKMQNRMRCSRTKNFEVVLANKATIKSIEIKDWTQNQNSVQVLLDDSSIGSYEYSIDGNNYQDSNIFEGLSPKEYTVYVREKNGCGTVSSDLFLLMYPKFFTPNEDGYNDTWEIKFSEIEPNLSIEIFDRYGKLLAQNVKQWDGKFQGNLLPSDDYWFIVKRENGKIYKGHFSLKR